MEIDILPDEYEVPEEHFPFPAPFVLTSVEKHWCCHNPERIVYIKRIHLQKNLLTFRDEIGMDEEEMKKFLDWWCSPRPGTAEIRAESDAYFNLRQRAETWMAKLKVRNAQNTPKPQQEEPRSRVESLKESMRHLHDFFHGKREQDTAPDEQ